MKIEDFEDALNEMRLSSLRDSSLKSLSIMSSDYSERDLGAKELLLLTDCFFGNETAIESLRESFESYLLKTETDSSLTEVLEKDFCFIESLMESLTDDLKKSSSSL